MGTTASAGLKVDTHPSPNPVCSVAGVVSCGSILSSDVLL